MYYERVLGLEGAALLVGSLAFLLYGMALMSGGIQKSASGKLQHALALMTTNRFAGILTGLIITTIIQSSGATTVMVISFINAGLLTLTQSVGVIFGANIGTTITAWIVSLLGFNFKISSFALPIFGVGFFLTLLKKSTFKSMGEALMGFGLLFVGLDGLGRVFTFQASDLEFLEAIQNNGILSIAAGFFIGVVVTLVMHSSSAFTAIVITLAFNKAVTWEIAAAMTIGSNIGSTVDAVLGAFGSCTDAKRSAFIHVFFNVVGAAMALILFVPLLRFVEFLSAGSNIAIRISIFHTVFKVAMTIILTPFIDQIVALSCRAIKDDPATTPKSYKLEFREIAGRENVTMYIAIAQKEISDMAQIALKMFDLLKEGFGTPKKRFATLQKLDKGDKQSKLGKADKLDNLDKEDKLDKAGDTTKLSTKKQERKFIDETIGDLEVIENYVDQMHEQLVSYIIECQRLPITEKQRVTLGAMTQVVDDLEASTDDQFACAMMIKKCIEKKFKFDDTLREKLIAMAEECFAFLSFVATHINDRYESDLFLQAQNYEDSIDAARDNLKKLVRKKLESKSDVKTHLLYLDIINAIEKIADWAFNIATLLR